MRRFSFLSMNRVSRTRKDSYVIHRYGLLKEGRLVDEYLEIDHPAIRLGLISDPVDVVSFPERAFLDTPRWYNFASRIEVIGLLRLKSYEDWFRSLKKTQRYMLRKAKKLGVEARPRRWDEKDAEAIYSLYHESSQRQGMTFSPYYSYSLANVQSGLDKPEASVVIFVAYLKGRLVGILGLRVGALGGRAQTMLVTTRRVAGVSNALIECAVREACARGLRFLIYGHMGYMSGLDDFKIHNGFRPFSDRRYYVPVTQKGAAFLKIGLCSEPWQLVPRPILNRVPSVGKVLSRFVELSPTPDDRYIRSSLLSNSEDPCMKVRSV